MNIISDLWIKKCQQKVNQLKAQKVPATIIVRQMMPLLRNVHTMQSKLLQVDLMEDASHFNETHVEKVNGQMEEYDSYTDEIILDDIDLDPKHTRDWYSDSREVMENVHDEEMMIYPDIPISTIVYPKPLVIVPVKVIYQPKEESQAAKVARFYKEQGCDEDTIAKAIRANTEGFQDDFADSFTDAEDIDPTDDNPFYHNMKYENSSMTYQMSKHLFPRDAIAIDQSILSEVQTLWNNNPHNKIDEIHSEMMNIRIRNNELYEELKEEFSEKYELYKSEIQANNQVIYDNLLADFRSKKVSGVFKEILKERREGSNGDFKEGLRKRTGDFGSILRDRKAVLMLKEFKHVVEWKAENFKAIVEFINSIEWMGQQYQLAMFFNVQKSGVGITDEDIEEIVGLSDFNEAYGDYILDEMSGENTDNFLQHRTDTTIEQIDAFAKESINLSLQDCSDTDNPMGLSFTYNSEFIQAVMRGESIADCHKIASNVWMEKVASVQTPHQYKAFRKTLDSTGNSTYAWSAYYNTYYIVATASWGVNLTNPVSGEKRTANWKFLKTLTCSGQVYIQESAKENFKNYLANLLRGAGWVDQEVSALVHW